MKKETIYLIILILGILIAGGYLLFFYKKPTITPQKPSFIFPKITSQEKTIKEKIAKVKEQSLSNPLEVPSMGNFVLARVGNDFEIDYITLDDRYFIQIWNPDFDGTRKKAEEYFLENVLKTRDPEIVCRIKVRFYSTYNKNLPVVERLSICP